MRSAWYAGCLSAGVSGALTASAAVKCLHGYPHGSKLSPEFYWCATAAELVIAALLWTKMRRGAAWGLMAFSVLGVVLEWTLPGTTCGCLGARITLTPRQHIALAAALGICGAFIATSRRPAAPAAATGRQDAATTS